MTKAPKPHPSSAPPPGVPLDQTIGPINYGGYDTPYRNLEQRRPWVRIWEWLTRPSPPRD
jgi:hypothetical protein